MLDLEKCPCAGKSLPRLLRPGIMAFLAQGEAHGYQIAQQLSRMHMFAGCAPDHAGVYRALKDMADEGLVTSAWQTGDTGPARRVYALSDAGRRCLGTWLSTLQDYRRAIDELLRVVRTGCREGA
jgi:PadR family transcriptional regulator PadR